MKNINGDSLMDTHRLLDFLVALGIRVAGVTHMRDKFGHGYLERYMMRNKYGVTNEHV